VPESEEVPLEADSAKVKTSISIPPSLKRNGRHVEAETGLNLSEQATLGIRYFIVRFFSSWKLGGTEAWELGKTVKRLMATLPRPPSRTDFKSREEIAEEIAKRWVDMVHDHEELERLEELYVKYGKEAKKK